MIHCWHWMDCGKVLSFPQISGSAPAPAPPGTRTAAGEEPLLRAPRFLRFPKKEMKFLLTKRTRSSSSSSAGKKRSARLSAFSGGAVSPRLEAAASLSSARFRLYHILFPAGQKVKLSLPQSNFGFSFLLKMSHFHHFPIQNVHCPQKSRPEWAALSLFG